MILGFVLHGRVSKPSGGVLRKRFIFAFSRLCATECANGLLMPPGESPHVCVLQHRFGRRLAWNVRGQICSRENNERGSN